MEDKELFDFYEKLYFHEIEIRSDMSNRLQIPFAILFAIANIGSYIISHSDFTYKCSISYIYYFLLIISTIFFALSGYYFIRVLVGNKYHFLPQANVMEQYRMAILEYYEKNKNIPDNSQNDFKRYLYETYNDCSSKNTITNDKRSYFIFKCNEFLICCTITLAVAYMILICSGINKDNHDKIYKVNIQRPVEVVVPNKSDNKYNTTNSEQR